MSRWPTSRCARRARLFGRAGPPDLPIADARMLLSFGADFVETWLSNVQYARDFAAQASSAGGPSSAARVSGDRDSGGRVRRRDIRLVWQGMDLQSGT